MEIVLIIGAIIYLIVGALIALFLEMANWHLVSLDMSPLAPSIIERVLAYTILCIHWLPIFIILFIILIFSNEKDSNSSI